MPKRKRVRTAVPMRRNRVEPLPEFPRALSYLRKHLNVCKSLEAKMAKPKPKQSSKHDTNAQAMKKATTLMLKLQRDGFTGISLSVNPVYKSGFGGMADVPGEVIVSFSRRFQWMG